MQLPVLIMCVFSSALLDGITVPEGNPEFRIEPDARSPQISYLSWDTEGGDRSKLNLLYAPVRLELQVNSVWKKAEELEFEVAENSVARSEYHVKPGDASSVIWRIEREEQGLSIGFTVENSRAAKLDGLRLVFPFDPKATATTVLPCEWANVNVMRLPVIISAPDLGQMLLECESEVDVSGSLKGVRKSGERHKVDFCLEWPVTEDHEVAFLITPVHLQQPEGLKDEELWRAVRRGWFNMLQPSSQWGSPDRPQNGQPGLLANNVVSDPVSCVLHMMSDHVFLVPELAPGVKAAPLLGATVDWWLDHGIQENGEMHSWRTVTGMLDANAGPLIGAWCYAETSGNTAWLERRIAVLERLADYLSGRDIDNDGLVEAVHSGNYGTQIGRFGSSAYDTINSGHKDAYGNALTYRAWRCLSDLERRLGRTEQAQRYSSLADRLKRTYEQTFYNPDTGWLGWWRSEDGELHDLSAPMITSIAILYGLVDVESGHGMLVQLWQKIESVGFTRFDLGVPLTLEPVRKGNYMLPRPGRTSRPHGAPEREDGSDTFQMYLNGGCCVSDAYYLITALNMVGETQKADRILCAMLKRQVEGVFENGGGFQNGVIDKYPLGAEFYDWNGNTCGYEGHLVYSFSFLQAVLLREPDIRARLFHPLFE